MLRVPSFSSGLLQPAKHGARKIKKDNVIRCHVLHYKPSALRNAPVSQSIIPRKRSLYATGSPEEPYPHSDNTSGGWLGAATQVSDQSVWLPIASTRVSSMKLYSTTDMPWQQGRTSTFSWNNATHGFKPHWSHRAAVGGAQEPNILRSEPMLEFVRTETSLLGLYMCCHGLGRATAGVFWLRDGALTFPQPAPTAGVSHALALSSVT